MEQTDALRAWMLRAFFLGRLQEQLAFQMRLGLLPVEDALKSWDGALEGLAHASLEAWGKPGPLFWGRDPYLVEEQQP